jgi:aspartate aminotransferase
VFQSLLHLPEDAILGLMSRYREDPSPRKVDLGVGVYRNEAGLTPVLDCVRSAERRILATQSTKSYVAPAGRSEFNLAVSEWVLGPGHPALEERRVRTIQAPGGCGALRVGAELIRAAAPAVTVHLSDPTWGNHAPLLGGCGLRLARYPYYEPRGHHLRFEAMLEHLSAAPPGDVVLIHACCHNPSGADLDEPQWRALIERLLERELIPFIDLAYQGLGVSPAADVAGLRLVVASVPESLVAVSFSKNLGLYRERVGALLAIGADATRADVMSSHVLQIARSIYSMPPDHGAAIAAEILTDAELRSGWMVELEAMRHRIVGMRALLADRLRAVTRSDAFEFLRTQRGMFSLLGVPAEAVNALRGEHRVYMTADGRINLAGVTAENVDYLAASIGSVL